jgi:flagellin
MTSINTNTSAMTALQSLSMINSSLDETQNRISTGYRVGAASDNAAYWSIATTMRSDNKALGAVEDALGLGQAKVDTAYTGMNAAIDVVDEIKVKLVAAKEPGVDRNKIQAEISELQKQLSSIATSASFSGENWLSFNAPANTSKSVVASFNRSAGGAVSVGTIEIDVSSLKLFGNDGTTPTLPAVAPANGVLDRLEADKTLLDVDGDVLTTGDQLVLTVSALNISTTALTQAKVDAATGEPDPAEAAYKSVDDVLNMMITNVETALGKMTTAASNLGAAKSSLFR